MQRWFGLMALLLAIAWSGPMPLQAQAPAAAPAEGPQYAVAYFSVAPASRSALVAAFNRYRDASRKQEGFVRFELFEQVGIPGAYVVVEAWRDQPAFEARAQAATTKEFQQAIQAHRITGYDERPYRNFTLSSPSPAAGGGDAVHVVSHVDTIGGEKGGGPDMVRRQAEASRKETGHLRYDVLQSPVRLNHFTVVETWANQRAFEAHLAASHTRQYREAMQPVTGSPIDERVYKRIE
jgi:quinol monooxygenase YgiN